jgi:hypothetical protein
MTTKAPQETTAEVNNTSMSVNALMSDSREKDETAVFIIPEGRHDPSQD